MESYGWLGLAIAMADYLAICWLWLNMGGYVWLWVWLAISGYG